MIIEIPNWPLSSIEILTVKKMILNWLFSFYKSERQSIGPLNNFETLYLEF